MLAGWFRIFLGSGDGAFEERRRLLMGKKSHLQEPIAATCHEEPVVGNAEQAGEDTKRGLGQETPSPYTEKINGFLEEKRKNEPARQERQTRKKIEGHNTTRRCLNPGEGSAAGSETDNLNRFLFLSVPLPSFLRIQTAGRCVVSEHSSFVSPVSAFCPPPVHSFP